MPHAVIAQVEPAPNSQTIKSQNKKNSRGLWHARQQLEDYSNLFNQSKLSTTINRLLQNNKYPITKIMSLGLGSLTMSPSQVRRLKQLSIFLAIAEHLEQISGHQVQLFAQDPAFSRTDEALLASFGVQILHTPSGSDLDEAGALIDEKTLLYSPFLTVDAYELLLGGSAPVRYLIGDDFNALVNKWPKHSAERNQVTTLMKKSISKYRRRAISGEGFWTEEDNSFTLAFYQIEEDRRQERMAKL